MSDLKPKISVGELINTGQTRLLVVVFVIACVLTQLAYSWTMIASLVVLALVILGCQAIFWFSDRLVQKYDGAETYARLYSVAFIFALFVFAIAAIVWGYGFMYERTAECWGTDHINLTGKQLSDTAFYFSVVTISTLGYGDLTPVGECRKLAMSQTLTGFLGLPLLAGLILHALTRKPAG